MGDQSHETGINEKAMPKGRHSHDEEPESHGGGSEGHAGGVQRKIREKEAEHRAGWQTNHG